MNTGVIIQARLSSTRLPGKVLKELPYGSGITVLQQVLRRLKKSERVQEIIVATTTGDEDGAIVEVAEREGVKWFRGSKDNVLSRYYLAAKKNNLDLIVRVTSDCPCIDPAILDMLIDRHIESGADYSSNFKMRKFPHGLDAEAFNFSAFEKAYREASEHFEREHVTPYMHRNPGLFKIASLEATEDLTAPEIRITLDTEEDYALLCAVFDYLYPENQFFGAKEVIGLFKEKPWLHIINKKIVQKKIFDTLEEELRETVRICELQDLKKAKEFLGTHLHEGIDNN